MSSGVPESSVVRPSDRKTPAGVWILVILDALFAGIVPLLLTIVACFSEEARQVLPVDPTSFVVRVLLTTGVILGGVLALRGEKRGRNLLVAAVIVHHVLIILNNIGMALADVPVEVSSERPWSPTRIWSNVLMSVLWIAVHVWYFLGKPTREYFSE